MIPAPERSVPQIARETLEEPVVRTTNRYWTEITLAMVAGHWFATHHGGYLTLLGMGAAAIGMNILLNIIEENLSSQDITNKGAEDG